MRLTILISIFGFIFSGSVYASYFEVCKIYGTVESDFKQNGEDISLTFLVRKSEPTICIALESYEPEACDEYVNKEYEIILNGAHKDSVSLGRSLELVQRKIADTKGNLYTLWRSPEDCK